MRRERRLGELSGDDLCATTDLIKLSAELTSPLLYGRTSAACGEVFVVPFTRFGGGVCSPKRGREFPMLGAVRESGSQFAMGGLEVAVSCQTSDGAVG